MGRLKVVTFKLEEELALEFYRIVQEKKRSISEVLRELVMRYVEQEKFKETYWEPKAPRKMKVY